MKKVLLLFVLVLTVCSTVKAQEESLTMLSQVGTIGTLDGREAMVVDLGGDIGKVAIATMNAGATSVDDAGKQFNMAEANNPATNGLTDGWYVPSADELTALCAKLEANDSQPGLKWKVSDASTLYFPAYQVALLGYCGMYVSSSSDNSTLVFTYNDNLELTKNIVAPMENPENIGWSVIRPFHKLPTAYSYVYPVYNDPDDVTKGIEKWETGKVSAIEVTSSTEPVTWGEAGKTTWYVVTGEDVTLSQGAICAGDVHLILADGAKLTSTGENFYASIQVLGTGNSLTIYGQTNQSGQLIANGGYTAAGIGGNNIADLRDGSYITINGGTVTAKGGSEGAGIGGGFRGSGSNITINGGTVRAETGSDAAGIGGGCYGNGTNITINGGTVTSYGGDNAAGIGGGYAGQEYPEGGQGSNITINGGNVISKTKGNYGSGIGSGINGPNASNIFVATWCIVKAGSSSNSTDVIENTGSDLATSLADKQYATIEPLPTVSASYVYPVYNDPDDVTKGVKEWATEKVIAYEVISSDAPVTWGEAGKETWYVVTGEDVTLSKGAVCVGNVNLILADGAQLTATGITDTANDTSTAGIQSPRGDGNSLAIYSQAEQSGQLEANGGVGSAGIGGGIGDYGYHITINGGIVTAHGGDFAAGIGGGHGGSGFNITINGGTVTANGGIDAAGIGGGIRGAGSKITINGGTVTATGGERGASIGGGYQGDCDYITINGGTVWAEGSRGCAGIGSGINGNHAYYIFVATTLIVKADGNNPPTTVIANNGGDLAKSLAGKRYVTIAEPLPTVSVSYVYPVYNDPDDVTKGIEKWETGKADAIEVTSVATPVVWGEAGKETWYVVTGEDVTLSQGAICVGNVNLILADGAKLTATGITDTANGIYTAGIHTSNGELTIYGQDAQSGQLIATGGIEAAGIGGSGVDGLRDGSNITINGGKITANGGVAAAGIGGGYTGAGYNITINGGTVTANGGQYGVGIGGGYKGECSNIFVAAILTLKADGSNPPTTVIENNHSDLAESLAGRQYVTITEPYFNITANQDPNNKTNYYSTFYSGTCDYQVPEGTTAYTGVAEGDVLQLTPIADGIIPAGEAVILRATPSETTSMQTTFSLTATTTSTTKSDDNMLQGSDEPMTLPQNSYALSYGQHQLGFYDFSGSVLPANKAYLTLDAASANGLRFSFGDATEIDAPEMDDTDVVIYSVSGVRLTELQQGINIVNGKKVLKR